MLPLAHISRLLSVPAARVLLESHWLASVIVVPLRLLLLLRLLGWPTSLVGPIRVPSGACTVTIAVTGTAVRVVPEIRCESKVTAKKNTSQKTKRSTVKKS